MKHPLLLTFALLATCSHAHADETPAAQRIAKATAKAADTTYDLHYKFSPSEIVRTKVIHLVTIETKVQGTTETAKTRSVSTRKWEIEDVDAAGNITFVHSVEAVDMWQKSSGRQEIHYDSQSNEKPPAEYEHVTESIGVPLATITIDRYGKIVKRESKRPQFNISIGDVAVPLPGQPIKIGQEWFYPEEIKVRLTDGSVKPIKARHKFTLQSVETGVATIAAATEILTPVNDPKIQSQLVQKMQRGTIKFDMDGGRVLSKQMDLDETVIGFNGATSLMQYLARLTEENVSADEPKTATKPSDKR
ncbi:MAG TPA: hypothetical protein VL096_11635 [Pirellulaceae bacterium]|nr:hypothetical protein [Pirellulaceae bacterium]